MAIRVAASATSRTPEQERTGARISRGRGLGEFGDMQELFEELMGGESLEGEGLEDFDWEGLWDSFMEEGGEGQEEQQGSYYPTMFGAPVRPSGFRRPEGLNAPGQGMFY